MISYFRVMKATTRTDAPWSNFRGFIKGQAPGKLAACDYSFSDRPWAHQGVFFFFFFFCEEAKSKSKSVKSDFLAAQNLQWNPWVLTNTLDQAHPTGKN